MKRSRLKLRLVNPASLNPIQISQICDIYLAHHYTDRQKCEARIRNGFDKMALFISREEGRIVGFNGMRINRDRITGFIRPILHVYLGQMYIEKAYRSMHPIQHAALHVMLRYKLLCPWLKTVIWGDALTYRPYLLIAQNGRTFFPHPDRETPHNYQNLIHFLGKKFYGNAFDPEKGTVSKSDKLIKEHVAPIFPRLLKNKYIGFYAQKNKAYKEGHGLLVVMDFDWKSAWLMMKKVFSAQFFQKAPKTRYRTSTT